MFSVDSADPAASEDGVALGIAIATKVTRSVLAISPGAAARMCAATLVV